MGDRRGGKAGSGGECHGGGVCGRGLMNGLSVNIFQDLTLLPISKKCAAPFLRLCIELSLSPCYNLDAFGPLTTEYHSITSHATRRKTHDHICLC